MMIVWEADIKHMSVERWLVYWQHMIFCTLAVKTEQSNE